MKWLSNVNKQSVLPILLGISLTTFGLSVAILLYNTIFEKEDNDNKKKYGQIATSKRKEICVKFKIPEKYVPAIIGKGGTVIKNIQKTTNTHIKMEKENLFSSERVCYVQSDDIKNIDSAHSLIQSIINNLPAIETFELFVPFEASRRVFKRNLNEIGFAQKIQKIHGAKVILENDIYKTETGLKRKIMLKGTTDQIALATIRIEDKIQKDIEAQVQLQMCIARMRSKSSLDNTDVKNTTNDYLDVETCELLVPRQVCGNVDRNGYTEQEIERPSDAKIMINNAVNKFENTERKVSETAKQRKIELASIQMENEIKQINEFQNELNRKSTMIIKRISDSSCNNGSLSNNVSKSALKQDDLMEVYVSAMETPNLFWIQVVGSANIDLQHLVHDMTKYYNEKENRQSHILKKITAGQMVAAKFKYDSKWYRAEVISVMESSECKVFFVDYGDLNIVPIDDILELRTDMLSLRFQAVECSLANIKPQESEWSSEANDKFAELTYLANWKPLIAKVKGYKERPIGYGGSRRQNSLIPCIDLFDEDTDKNINIGDSLIQLGMAQIEEEIWSTINSTLSRNNVLGGRRYIAIPVDDIDGIDVIEVNPIASLPSLPRMTRQTEVYVPVVVSTISRQDDSEVQRSEVQRSAARILDYVDFGGHTGSNGAFSWYADYPTHRL